jgi:hypothetical protein
MHRKIYFPFAERSSETPPLRWGKIKIQNYLLLSQKIRHLGEVYGLSSLLREENYAKPNPTEIKNGCLTIKATTTILIWCCITRGIFTTKVY